MGFWLWLLDIPNVKHYHKEVTMKVAMDSVASNLKAVGDAVTTTIQPAVIGLAIAAAVVVLGRLAIKKFLKF